MNTAITKLTPGDDKHLTLLMAPFNLNFFVGKDREDILAYGRAVWAAALASQADKSQEDALTVPVKAGCAGGYGKRKYGKYEIDY